MTDEETQIPPVPWHQLSAGDAQRRLEVDASQGLSHEQVRDRKNQHGLNQLPQGRRVGAWQRFLLQFNNVLIYVLLGAAVVTGLLGHWVDTGVIVAVVLLNALIGYLQEGKAEKAMDAIRGMLSLQASVTRAGQRRSLPAEELVPGDVVHLQSGDKVPADARLVEVRGLRVEEAPLTGESEPVEKNLNPVPGDATLGDRRSMVYAGTLVTSGQATAIVVATGAATEIGRINALVAAAPTMTTPLLRQVARFGRGLTIGILALAALVFVFGFWIRGYAFGELFLAIVGLAVAAIPEGLPAIMTITLAIGVQAMARRHAIIRRLPAVETLGSVTVICSDKTGTLTRNEMTVTSVVTGSHLYHVSGVGYQPEGHLSLEINRITPGEHPPLPDLARVALLCNDSRLEEKDGLWRVDGDPTEGALLCLGAKAGFDRQRQEHVYPRLDSIPFESEHKFMATLHAGPEGHVILLKGAPERVLERCQHQRTAAGDQPLDREYWEKAMDHIAGRGERLLALALKPVATSQTQLAFADVEEGLILLGLTGIIDPPRDEAIAAIRECHDAGITVKMITGDHARTAGAIAAQIGLGRGKVVTGADLEGITDANLPQVVSEGHVFARTTPEHKLRLVRALQSLGKVVAMTGDGVNDAPALKAADVGIAMGIKGTEAAKEAAEMVLADDNFASIAHAVEEGRTVYDNLKKSILFILPTNGAQALVVIIAILFGLTLPVTPAQVLWVNMITAVTLGLALAFEPPERAVMRRPPRNAQEPLLPPFFLWRIGFVSVLIMIGTMSMFQWTLARTGEVELARTAAVGTLIFGQICYLLNSRFIFESSLRRDLLSANPYVIYAIGLVALAQLLFTYLPAMNLWFGSAPLRFASWVPMIFIGALIFAAVEVEKIVLRPRRAHRL
jgi:magnesium-transporting ATPase (P-type)